MFKWLMFCVSKDMQIYHNYWLIFVFCSFRLDDTLDEATRKDLFTDTFCKVCRAVLQFESQRASHYKVGWKGEFLLASTGALAYLFGLST